MADFNREFVQHVRSLANQVTGDAAHTTHITREPLVEDILRSWPSIIVTSVKLSGIIAGLCREMTLVATDFEFGLELPVFTFLTPAVHRVALIGCDYIDQEYLMFTMKDVNVEPEESPDEDVDESDTFSTDIAITRELDEEMPVLLRVGIQG
jgi:hypothetical protein